MDAEDYFDERLQNPSNKEKCVSETAVRVLGQESDQHLLVPLLLWTSWAFVTISNYLNVYTENYQKKLGL